VDRRRAALSAKTRAAPVGGVLARIRPAVQQDRRQAPCPGDHPEPLRRRDPADHHRLRLHRGVQPAARRRQPARREPAPDREYRADRQRHVHQRKLGQERGAEHQPHLAPDHRLGCERHRTGRLRPGLHHGPAARHPEVPAWRRVADLAARGHRRRPDAAIRGSQPSALGGDRGRCRAGRAAVRVLPRQPPAAARPALRLA